MTQEEHTLLFRYLCMAIPYDIVVRQADHAHVLRSANTYTISFDSSCAIPKPYLRPMLSMTEEEENQFCAFMAQVQSMTNFRDFAKECGNFMGWLLAHHLDFRGFIPKGLALEAEEWMYKKKED